MEEKKISPVTLTHTFRLPDEIQAESLRFVAASRKTTNETIEKLWGQLDVFKDTKGQAWKQSDRVYRPGFFQHLPDSDPVRRASAGQQVSLDCFYSSRDHQRSQYAFAAQWLYHSSRHHWNYFITHE